MSVHVMSWVLRNSEATLGKRLVLLALADSAEDDGGNAWPSVATLSTKTRLSERQVQYALRQLEKDGAIQRGGRHRTREQRYGTNVYCVLMKGADIAPFADDRRVQPATAKGAISGPQRVQPTAPEPSLDPSEEPSNPPVAPPLGNWQVDRKPVTSDELAVAQSVLAEWNVLTRQSLRSRDWLAKIVMRVRERPELGVNEHVHIIRVALEHPWWKGEASPSVVYGNGALFEQQLMQAAKGNVGGARGAFQVALAALQAERGAA